MDIEQLAALHIAGFDSEAIRSDPVDVFGNDPDIGPDPPYAPNLEHLPQFGPPFVQYVHRRFDKLEKVAEKLLQRWAYEPTTVGFIAAIATTGSGGIDLKTNGNAMIYETPPGFTLALHRLSIAAVGFNFGTPYTNAGAYLEIRVDDQMVDGNSLVSGQGSLPTIGSWGTRDAIRIRDGSQLSLFMSGGPANTTVTVLGQGTLERQAES